MRLFQFKKLVNYAMFSFLIVVCVMLWVGYQFNDAHDDLDKYIERAQHIACQKVSDRVLNLAKIHMLAPKAGGMDMATEFGKLEYRIKQLYDPYKPNYCWDSPAEVWQELKVNFMFAVAHELSPGGKDSVQAFEVARSDPGFAKALVLEQKLMQILCVSSKRVKNWDELRQKRESVESLLQDIERSLDENIIKDVNEDVIPLPKVYVPDNPSTIRPGSPIPTPNLTKPPVKKSRWC